MPKPSSHRTSLRYKFILFILSPAALAYTIYRSLKDGGWRYFCNRLGLNYPQIFENTILLHCASVGEFNAAKPLITRLAHTLQNTHFVISTNTPTAANLVSAWKQNNVTHVYLPLDYSIFVKRFLTHIKPKCVLILETEIWPNLFSITAKNNIAMAIINGRLTKKTLAAKGFIKKEYASILKNLNMLLARSEEDRKNYISIGVNKSSAHTIGNLKYAATSNIIKDLPSTTIKRPFFLAASTHHDEELQLAQHVELLKKKNYLLAIAPRYPDQGVKILHRLEQEGFNVALRSHKDIVDKETEIYIIDTLGELDMYFNEAALVFVGGSLIQRGGHNILEPAKLGKCILVGPYMDNFSFETNELLTAKSLLQVSNNHELGIKLVELLNNDSRRIEYAKNAENFMREKSNVLDLYIQHVQKLIS